MLLYHAEIYDTFKNAKEFGIDVSDFKLNWPATLARKDRIVNRHAKGIEFLFRKHKVETMRGWGRWAGPGRVSVETDGKITEVEATHIMFATGSEARSLPGVEFDGKVILGNREILNVPEVPKSLVIVGAGAVGVEFASIFQSFGATVTILEMLPRMVPLEDEEISAEIEKAFRKRGIQIFLEAKVESVQKDSVGATVSFRDKSGQAQTLSAERVLMAVGRAPLTSNLGLDKTRVKIERGFVQVGPFMETDEPHVYAIGDIVAGMPQLAHAASMEGIVAVGKITGKPVRPLERRRIPNATYCEPQIGSIGLTERQAREAGLRRKGGEISVPGQQQGLDPQSPRGLHQGGGRGEKRRAARCAHHRPASHGDSRRAGDRAATGSHRGRHDVHGACASDRVGGLGRRLLSVRGVPINI